MGRVTAIETSYAGCRFRSRLEARWAVSFDHLGVRWQYEPQGFNLPSGNYLPDFLLDLGNDRPFFAEIKGSMPDTREFTVASEINLYVGPLIILAGDLPRRRTEGTGWIFVPVSGEGPEVKEWAWEMTTPEKAVVYGGTGGNRIEIPAWEDGMTAGRSARFEHGEKG